MISWIKSIKFLSTASISFFYFFLVWLPKDNLYSSKETQICFFSVDSNYSSEKKILFNRQYALKENQAKSKFYHILYQEILSDKNYFYMTEKSIENLCEYFIVFSAVENSESEKSIKSTKEINNDEKKNQNNEQKITKYEFRLYYVLDGNLTFQYESIHHPNSKQFLEKSFTNLNEWLRGKPKKKENLLKNDQLAIYPYPSVLWETGISFQYFYLMGDLGEQIDPGLLTTLHLSGNFFLIPFWKSKQITTFLDVGILYRSQKKDDLSFKYLYSPITLGMGYRIYLNNRWQIIPELFSGVSLSQLKARVSNFSTSAVFGARLNLIYKIHPRHSIATLIGYSLDSNIYTSNRALLGGIRYQYGFNF